MALPNLIPLTGSAAPTVEYNPETKFGPTHDHLEAIRITDWESQNSGKCIEGSWNIPLAGDFHGGRTTGEGIAALYLKNLRTSPSVSFHNNPLSDIVVGLMKKASELEFHKYDLREETPIEVETLHGQVIGLFYSLGGWLYAKAHHAEHLSTLSVDDCMTIINEGLAGVSYDDLEDKYPEGYIPNLVNTMLYSVEPKREKVSTAPVVPIAAAARQAAAAPAAKQEAIDVSDHDTVESLLKGLLKNSNIKEAPVDALTMQLSRIQSTVLTLELAHLGGMPPNTDHTAAVLNGICGQLAELRALVEMTLDAHSEEMGRERFYTGASSVLSKKSAS